MDFAVRIASLAIGIWLVLMLSALAALWHRPDVHVEIWAGASNWAPWKTAAKAIQWYRQRSGREVLDRIVDFHRER
jgi:hypothetical protein